MMHATVELLRTGKAQHQQWSDAQLFTAAVKNAHHGPVFLSETGFDGDEQGNLKHHGGPEKAVCCYPLGHYQHWQDEGLNIPVGGFFENLTLAGVDELDVCLGDMFQLGETVVQVTQPRRPCTTLSKKWGLPQLPRLVQETGRSGFYLRVLKTGEVQVNDELVLVDRLENAVSVAETNRVMNVDRFDRAGINRVLASPELPERWRAQLQRRREKGIAEDDSDRLGDRQFPTNA